MNDDDRKAFKVALSTKDNSKSNTNNSKKILLNQYNQSTPLNTSNLLMRSGQNFQDSIDLKTSDKESKSPIL